MVGHKFDVPNMPFFLIVGFLKGATYCSLRQQNRRRHQRPCPRRKRRSPGERSPTLNPPRYILPQRVCMHACTQTEQTQHRAAVQVITYATTMQCHRTDAGTGQQPSVQAMQPRCSSQDRRSHPCKLLYRVCTAVVGPLECR